jgi:hypothetical protein
MSATKRYYRVGNGWYRYYYYFCRTNDAGLYASYNWQSDALNWLELAGYTFGGTIEAGAYATSYIPTLGAAVTRLAGLYDRTGLLLFGRPLLGRLMFIVRISAGSAEITDTQCGHGNNQQLRLICINNSG